MKTHLSFPPILGIFALIFLALAFCTACTMNGAKVDVTIVPEFPTIKDEVLTVPMDGLPFNVQIPSGWTFIESGGYELVFDQGASGSLQFSKTPKTETFDDLIADGWEGVSPNPSGFEILFKDSTTNDSYVSTRYFALKLIGQNTVYSAVLINKTLTPERLAEIDQIIQSLKVD